MSDRIAFAAEIKAEGRRLRGSVVLRGQRTFRNGEWVEVDPTALMRADASDVSALFDHDKKNPLGRTINGSLSLSRTEDGIEWETGDLPNTTGANDALELVRQGLVPGSSFTIDGIRSKFSVNPDDGLRIRTINSIKRLVDVAPVQDPAFANSTAAAFSKESGMSDEPKNPEPQPEPPDEPVPAAFREPKPKVGWEFAASKMTTEDLSAQADSLMASEGFASNVELIERVEIFNAEISRRRTNDAEMKRRAQTVKAVADAIAGRQLKAPAAEMFASDDYTEAFAQYLRDGKSSHMEQFAQSIAGSGAEGGFTVPDGFLQRITERLKAFGGIAGVADEITTSTGESLRWPSNDDTANSAAIAAEGVAGAAGADLVFDSIELGAFSYDANGAGNVPVKVSLELLQDSAFDIAALIERKLAERIGRKQAVDLANGGGTTEPVGLLTKSADTMTATDASLAYVEQIFQVDSEYRSGGNCRWLMSDTTLAKLAASQASGVPVFSSDMNAGITHGIGSGLGGYPITIDPAAAALVAFGDFRRGYIVRRVRGIQLLVDPYTLSGVRQVAYHAWARMDANIQDSFAYSVSDWAGVSAAT